MATIAAFIDGPGLGKPVLDGLSRDDVGGAFVPGMLIVIMAIMLDRTTTAASERAEQAARGGGDDPRAAPDRARRRRRRRRWSRSTSPATTSGPPSSPRPTSARRSPTRSTTFDRLAHRHLRRPDRAPSRTSSPTALLNPMQSLLAESPWCVTALAICAIAFVARRAARAAVHRRLPGRHLVLRPVARRDDHPQHDAGRHAAGDGPGGGLRGLDGPRAGRSTCVIRPLLDAGQTIPPFVYLIPVLPSSARPGSPRSSRASSTPPRSPSSWSPTASGRSRRPRIEASPVDRHDHVAGDHQGAAADGARARWCWPPTRGCSTCCPWSSSAAWSAPARSATTSCSASRAARSGARAWPPGITIVLLGDHDRPDRHARPPTRGAGRHAGPAASGWRPRPDASDAHATSQARTRS